VHHKAGRVGKLLTDPTHFLSICRNCHAYLHDRMSRAEAVERGLKINP
jgi:predicted HNH restriction endonuclease